MRGEFHDNFTENDVLGCLEAAGLKYKKSGRYILSCCPLHEENNPSCQIYTQDWWANCHSGCGRFHITKAFPELSGSERVRPAPRREESKPKVTAKDCSAEIMAIWQSLPEIPADHKLKNMEANHLNIHGWRYDAAHQRYLIPYWSRSKQSVPFAQWRNLTGSVRFNFWKDAKPTMYGTWNLEPGQPIFLVEGTSDGMVLDYCAVPWIAIPSASQIELLKPFGQWCRENNVKVIYAGDRDDAGDGVKDALDGLVDFRTRQVRDPYKDWAEMFEAEGFESVQDYCLNWLQGPAQRQWAELSDLERVQSVFPGAKELKLV